MWWRELTIEVLLQVKNENQRDYENKVYSQYAQPNP
jgi:hypothetical protein